VHGNPFRGLPPDPLHREDNGVWLTFIDAFSAALKAQFPTTRRKRARGDEGEAEDESHSDKIDEVNERLAKLAIEGRWESFNIPSDEYLPEHTNAQVSPLSRRGSGNCAQLSVSADRVARANNRSVSADCSPPRRRPPPSAAGKRAPQRAADLPVRSGGDFRGRA